jgi:carbon-monoxide dehydrogenase large subunit
MAHAVIVRSPHAHAHARIASVDKAAALASPGVLAVLTGRDYVADGLAPIPHGAGLMGRPDVAARVRGFQPITTRDYPMPPDRARFVGEPVAMVVAETIDQAKDAAELLEIVYEPLPTVVRAADAVKPGAPRLWDDAPDNLCVDIEVGDGAATAAAFRRPLRSFASTLGCSASQASRWSRERQQPSTMPRPDTTRFTPGAAAALRS